MHTLHDLLVKFRPIDWNRFFVFITSIF
jgi:hypothetical protein